jgi:NAD(P)-dependent dehydrogenase (short-subunit alcohol dehydrogenase family)
LKESITCPKATVNDHCDSRAGRPFVTGAGRGTGRAIAELYGREGARVVIASRSADEIERADPEGMAAAVAAIPVGRNGDPHLDIAPGVLFLAADDAR